MQGITRTKGVSIRFREWHTNTHPSMHKYTSDHWSLIFLLFCHTPLSHNHVSMKRGHGHGAIFQHGLRITQYWGTNLVFNAQQKSQHLGQSHHLEQIDESIFRKRHTYTYIKNTEVWHSSYPVIHLFLSGNYASMDCGHGTDMLPLPNMDLGC